MTVLYKIFKRSEGVCTDTRALRPGQLFFALKGENFDGNAFVQQALDAGAAAAVSSVPSDNPAVITVEDTLETLKALALEHRRALGIPVVGLSGTNGKTTTKELIRAVLAAKFRVVATEGNLNNEIGVPLSVLKFKEDTEIGIIEMGASHPEDLKPLLSVAEPTCGLITNVGKAHLQGFGSFEGVKKAKGMLYDWLGLHGGTVFSNGSDPVLEGMLSERGLRSIKYFPAKADVRPVSMEEPTLAFTIDCTRIETALAGAYNVANILAALKVGEFFGVPREDAIKAVESYKPSNSRSQIQKTERNTLIVDAYNANPSSMALALDNLALSEGRTAALLGDMRELGADSQAEHRKIADTLGRFDYVAVVGDEFTAASDGRYPCFKTSQELAEFLQAHPLEGYTILVKGSRGIRMENVISSL